MSWFPVDDGAHSHPKMRRAGLEAVGLWTVSGSFCMAYLTDGFVPEWFVKEKPRGVALAKRLVDSGLWHAGDRGDEKGWWFHDWKPECTKVRIEEAREQARLRKQKSRESKRDEQPMSRVTDTVTGCVTDASRHAGVLGYPAQPSPAQPINTLVTSSGEVTKATREDPPPIRCHKHSNEVGPVPPCRACGDARTAADAWHASRAATAKADAAERRRNIDACAMCDDQGMRDVGRGAARCDHRLAAIRA